MSQPVACDLNGKNRQLVENIGDARFLAPEGKGSRNFCRLGYVGVGPQLKLATHRPRFDGDALAGFVVLAALLLALAVPD